MRKRSITLKPQVETEDESLQPSSTTSETSVTTPLCSPDYYSSNEDIAELPQVNKYQVKAEIHEPPRSPSSAYDPKPSISRSVYSPSKKDEDLTEASSRSSSGTLRSSDEELDSFMFYLDIAHTCNYLDSLLPTILSLTKEVGLMKKLPDESSDWEIIQFTQELIDQASNRIIKKVYEIGRSLQDGRNVILPEDFQEQKQIILTQCKEIVTICTTIRNRLNDSANNIKTFSCFTPGRSKLKLSLLDLCCNIRTIIFDMTHYIFKLRGEILESTSVETLPDMPDIEVDSRPSSNTPALKCMVGIVALFVAVVIGAYIYFLKFHYKSEVHSNLISENETINEYNGHTLRMKQYNSRMNFDDVYTINDYVPNTINILPMEEYTSTVDKYIYNTTIDE